MKFLQLQTVPKILNKPAWTLIEILVTCSVVTLLATLAVKISLPNNSELIAKQELLLVTAFLAKECAQAYATQHPTTICWPTTGDSLHAASDTMQFTTLRIQHPAGYFGPPGDPQKPLEGSSSYLSNKLFIDNEGIPTPGSLYFVNRTTGTVYAVTIPVGAVPTWRIYRASAPASWQLLSIEC